MVASASASESRPPEHATTYNPGPMRDSPRATAPWIASTGSCGVLGMTSLYMTEPEAPPLARLRAQLAGPRGVRRIDALISADDAAAAVASLTPSEVFELVHEVGFEDAQDLIELATPSQIQGCLDLDGWNKDHLEAPTLAPWLTALVETGFENLGLVWSQLDVELRALIVQQQATIYDVSLGEEPAEDSEASIFTTP